MFDLLRPVLSQKHTPAVLNSSENSLRVAQVRVLRIWPMRQKVALRGKELNQTDVFKYSTHAIAWSYT